MSSKTATARTRVLDAKRLWRLARLGGLALSPDGTRVACTVTEPDVAANAMRASIWLLPVRGRGVPRRLTACGEKDGAPVWSPDGTRLAFTARRRRAGVLDGSPQLYVIAADGGEALRVSDFAPGIEAFRWTPDGCGIVFVSWLWPGLKGAAAQARRHAQERARLSTGYVTTEGQYRHWDRFLPQGRAPRLCHLDVASGRVQDLFEGTDLELPRADPGLEHFDLSPDGRSLAFVRDPSPHKASSHCAELAELDLRTRRARVLGAAGPWDFTGPRYAPDGQRLAVVATRRGEQHTAFGQLAVFDLASGFQGATVPGELDVQPMLRWSADARQVCFLADEKGRCHVWRHDLAGHRTEVAVHGGTVLAFEVDRGEHPCIVTLADSALHPPRIHVHRPGAAPRRLERFNDTELEGVSLGRVEERTVTGALGEAVQMWLVYPPGFDARRRHPVCQVIHGGPYVASGDSFSWRWNAHVLASRGQVVAMVNYHGSSGFGWAFRHAIVGRQGELEGQDLEAATDWLRRQRWVDPQRIHAAGGSYGGYLVAWLNGHAAVGRYRSIVCHAGVFDRVATWSADSYTERHRDLGATYWEDPERVRAQSPATFAGAMHTPTFVTHGALDYRVPDHNGLALYNTLQARGVPARLLWFPDENHWVLKPQNSLQWYAEVLDWLERPPEPAQGPARAASVSAPRRAGSPRSPGAPRAPAAHESPDQAAAPPRPGSRRRPARRAPPAST